jgi:hypothetical protein
MSITLSDAVDDLLGRRTQDAGRLNLLAQFCVEAFDRHGLKGVRGGKANEVGIRGLGAVKRIGTSPLCSPTSHDC